MEFISPQIDFAFKRIFGNEKHKSVLVSFLNAVLALPDDTRVVEVELANPYQVPRLKHMKETVLDIKARDQYKREFIVEMQVEHQHDFYKRALYYGANAYVNQLARGTNFKELMPVYFIGVLNFKALQGDDYLSHHLFLDKKTNEQFVKDFEFCFIELPKFNKHEDELSNIIEKWVFFIKYLGSAGGEDKDFWQIFANDPPILEALETAKYYSLSKKERSIYEYQEKVRMVAYANIDSAVRRGTEAGLAQGRVEGYHEGRVEGLAEGRAEGLAEGKRAGIELAVRALAKQGLSSASIADNLGIDQVEVERLLAVKS